MLQRERSERSLLLQMRPPESTRTSPSRYAFRASNGATTIRTTPGATDSVFTPHSLANRARRRAAACRCAARSPAQRASSSRSVGSLEPDLFRERRRIRVRIFTAVRSRRRFVWPVFRFRASDGERRVVHRADDRFHPGHRARCVDPGSGDRSSLAVPARSPRTSVGGMALPWRQPCFSPSHVAKLRDAPPFGVPGRDNEDPRLLQDGGRLLGGAG